MTQSAAATAGPKAEDVKRAMTEASRHKATAAEYSGSHGQVVKAFCERWGTNRKAFGWTRQLSDMEDDKRQACIRDFIDLSRKMGFFDQGDLFDDAGAKAAGAEAELGKKPADAAVKSKADRAEPRSAAAARKKEETDAKKRAKATADELRQAPGFVGKTFAQRMADQNGKVDEDIKTTSGDLAGENAKALGSLVN